MSNSVLMNGDCLELLKSLPDNSLDSLVTDPPAGISFMGKEWDDDKGGRKQWVAWMTEVMTECLRVLKPGAHGLVWALPRTSHWTATALEDAGFEVRDVVTHLFGTGFPKSMDISKAIDKAAGAERKIVGPDPQAARRNKTVSKFASTYGEIKDAPSCPITAPSTEAAKQWAGWGTALKPASEHWVLIRKPCSEKTVAANVLKHGVGGINIDGSRIKAAQAEGDSTGGRFPANLILDEEAAAALDAQSGFSRSVDNIRNNKPSNNLSMSGANTGHVSKGHNDSGGASRFFYVAKASKSDKGEGNTHPTVKSRALMSYLIKLVTPPGGVVLDPFMGSGSTGVAALGEGFAFIGIEKDEAYYAIAEARLETNS